MLEKSVVNAYGRSKAASYSLRSELSNIYTFVICLLEVPVFVVFQYAIRGSKAKLSSGSKGVGIGALHRGKCVINITMMRLISSYC